MPINRTRSDFGHQWSRIHAPRKLCERVDGWLRKRSSEFAPPWATVHWARRRPRVPSLRELLLRRGLHSSGSLSGGAYEATLANMLTSVARIVRRGPAACPRRARSCRHVDLLRVAYAPRPLPP